MALALHKGYIALCTQNLIDLSKVNLYVIDMNLTIIIAFAANASSSTLVSLKYDFPHNFIIRVSANTI